MILETLVRDIVGNKTRNPGTGGKAGLRAVDLFHRQLEITQEF